MRIGPRYDDATERIGAALNMVPTPVGLAMFGMPIARSLQVAQRTGVFRELAQGGPRSAADLAARLDLREQGLALLLDALCAAGVLRLRRDGRYALPKRAAKWLDPGSPAYVGEFVADTAHYWDWWARLEDLVRDGTHVELHDTPADDPYWRSYITGQHQLARLSSAAVARAVALPGGARSLLDVAGAHGEFSMALCRRHADLTATVVDLPGSARIGRELVAAAGMAERVRHVEGDMFATDLGGPHDGALAFNIVHHLSPERAQALFARIAATLKPGAPLCVLDLYDRPAGERPDNGALLGLFFHLTSGADTYAIPQVTEWLARSGFGPAKVKRLPQIPGLALLRAERTDRAVGSAS
jgi:cyclopropane fatty-acyl-phospholipid synthase-like methyltransferase